MYVISIINLVCTKIDNDHARITLLYYGYARPVSSSLVALTVYTVTVYYCDCMNSPIKWDNVCMGQELLICFCRI